MYQSKLIRLSGPQRAVALFASVRHQHVEIYARVYNVVAPGLRTYLVQVCKLDGQRSSEITACRHSRKQYTQHSTSRERQLSKIAHSPASPCPTRAKAAPPRRYARAKRAASREMAPSATRVRERGVACLNCLPFLPRPASSPPVGAVSAILINPTASSRERCDSPRTTDKLELYRPS